MPDRILRALFRCTHADRLAFRTFRRVNGHRGKFLLLFSFIYLFVGYGYLTVTTPGRRQTFAWLPEWGMAVLAWPWLIAAGIAILSAWRRMPPRTDRFGFMAIATVPFLWGCMFLISWVFGYSAIGWLSSVTYFALAAIVTLVSSWPNAIEIGGSFLPPRPPEDCP